MEKKDSGFDRLAYFYDTLLLLTSGNLLRKSRGYHLNTLHPCQSCLIVGGGTGDILLSPEVQKIKKITFLEASANMLEVAQKKARKIFQGKEEQVYFLQRKIEDYTIENQKFDLIVFNFFLDQFSNEKASEIIRKTKQWLQPNGVYLCTDFNYKDQPTGKRIFYRLIIQLLYLFFYLVTGLKNQKLPNISKCFQNEGFESDKIKYFSGGLIRTDIWKKTSV